MGDIKGRWVIPEEAYSEYLDTLHDYLFKTKGRPINLVEQPRPNQPKPLLIDLDFKFPGDTSLTHSFTPQQISGFVRKVSEGLQHFFHLEAYESLSFFVSLRPQAYQEVVKDTKSGKQSQVKRIKDGIHIQCPDIWLSNEKQKVLRLWILEQQAIEESFDGIGYINEPEDVYDEAMVRKQGWFFYGESKPSIPPYKLEMVLSYNPETSVLDTLDPRSFPDRELMEILSVRMNPQVDDNEIRDESKEEFDKFHQTPSTASSRTHTTAPPAIEGGSSSNAASNHPMDDSSSNPITAGLYIPEGYDDDEITLIKRLTLDCLSVARADAYKTWMEVGWCLYNIDSSDEMFDTWVEFSKKSDKSEGTDWGKYKRDWSRGFTKNTAGAKLTIKSLHYWARNDNPSEYAKLVEEDHIRYIQYKVLDNHYHIAKLLKRVYKGRYCASVESRRTEWYVYDDKMHSWRHTNQAMDLKEKLSTVIVSLVVAARERFKQKNYEDWKAKKESEFSQQGAVQGKKQKDSFSSWMADTVDGERFQNLVTIEHKLYQEDFKSGVMKAAVELFYEEDFTNLLNGNPYLLACRNGVLDLRNEITDPVTGETKQKVIFRPGKPDDYISFMVGRNFSETEPLEYIPYDPEDEKQKELMAFLKKIFPAPDVLRYYIRLMASCLEGMNREQCYYTFIGVGGNGKSKVVDLMRYTLGDYAGSLQATALTRKRPDSGAANPDIISIKNKRFIYLQEPDDREPLNTSRMKQFSGEDIVEARGLFEDQQRFRITGKLFMMCNRFPPIHAMDRGTWRRIRVLLFGSKFVDSTDPELRLGRSNVFLRDNGLDAKIREWREAWLSLLVHVYETEYLVTGMEPIPACVMEESNKYKESFDQYGKFKAERMIDFRNPRLGLTEHGNEQVTLRDVQLAYNAWTRQNEGTLAGKKLNKQELQARLDEDFGNLDNGVYKRCVIFMDDEAKEEFIRDRAE